MRKWNKSKKIIDAYFPKYDFEFTVNKGQASQLAQAALQNGYETITAVGGDGTLNEVINGFFQNGKLINPQAKLAFISLGTGCDFGRMMNFPKRIKKALMLIENGRTMKCNIGKMSCLNEAGEKIQRYFLNIAEAGFGAETVRRVGSNTKNGHRKLIYLLGLLQTLTTYKNQSMEIKVDGITAYKGKTLATIIANGEYFGGGMHIAPHAQIDDGVFEVIVIGDLTKFNIIRNIYRLYNGTIFTHPQVKCVRGREISISSDEQTVIEADGDFVGVSPVKFTMHPESINLIC